VIFRRNRFAEVIRRQLGLFEVDEAALLAESREAEETWRRAGREEAEEAYGDWQLVVEAIGERLSDIRDAFASTLEDEPADTYRRSFDHAAEKRFGVAPDP
jgi:hypothetical protein